MNRSFQSIAALLISLSGAMLAVMWTPAEGPRPTPVAESARRRGSAVPCGYVATGPLVASRQGTTSIVRTPGPSSSAADPVEEAINLPKEAPLELNWDENWLSLGGIDLTVVSRTMADAPPVRAAAAAFGQALRPLWPLGASRPMLADQSLRDAERQRIEAEYAAAELAAANAGGQRWLADLMDQAKSLASRAVAAAQEASWISISQRISSQLNSKYDEIITDLGWQETLRPLLAHLRRQHERLALREALLKEMDRRFLESPINSPAGPLPLRPKFRPSNRRLYMAAADALKSLSRALNAAAEQLESVSRQDVAELHNPLQNSEEKR